jgi:hypothetical protein
MVMIYKLNRFGLGNDDGPLQGRARVRGTTGGFVDLGNEHEYAAGGHQASGANEIFADVQGDRPWFVLISLCICKSLLIAYYFLAYYIIGGGQTFLYLNQLSLVLGMEFILVV